MAATEPSECPKCRRLRRTRPEGQVGHCPTCLRFLFVYQLTWRTFLEATHRHLGCFVCGEGALCRDLALLEGEDARRCSYGAHQHEIDKCDVEGPQLVTRPIRILGVTPVPPKNTRTD